LERHSCGFHGETYCSIRFSTVAARQRSRPGVRDSGHGVCNFPASPGNF
jgi:hypothetical protein